MELSKAEMKVIRSLRMQYGENADYDVDVTDNGIDRYVTINSIVKGREPKQVINPAMQNHLDRAMEISKQNAGKILAKAKQKEQNNAES